MHKIKSLLPGIIICFFIALIGWYLGKLFPIIGGAVFGILLGMLFSFFKRPAALNVGIKFTSKKILQYSIILLGFEMNIMRILVVGRQSLFIMIFSLSAAFLSAYFISKLLKIKSHVAILIGVGTSICGGSAIAATAPVIQAKDDEVARAISTIFLFNIIAVFLFPLLGHLLNMNDVGFGMWAGTAINDTSSVVAAASSWSTEALKLATIVKLTRTLMIVPITLVLSLYMSKKASGSEKSNFNFSKVFPWFVIGFVIASLIKTVGLVPDNISSHLVDIGKYMIIMAMTAIGLNTNVKELINKGARPIILGLCCWFCVAVVSLLVQTFMNIW